MLEKREKKENQRSLMCCLDRGEFSSIFLCEQNIDFFCIIKNSWADKNHEKKEFLLMLKSQVEFWRKKISYANHTGQMINI